ncbi:MAG: hypothetical protein M3083_06860 [Actinomycetota bacterium]|nr:hypothetical protein [Actinomycetota bacterium]MDQ6945251.1 hypothetical protein [Actinomycetota bacterium]
MGHSIRPTTLYDRAPACDGTTVSASMEMKPAVKKLARPAAALVTKIVTRAVGPRLSALEHAHGDTWLEVQTLKAYDPLPVVEARLEPRLAALELAHGTARSEVQQFKDYVPAVLDAVSDQHAITRTAVRAERQLTQQMAEQAARLGEIERRAEFVRRELLFELRYGGASRGIGISPPSGGDRAAGVAVAVEAKVLNEAKLRSFGDDIRLNLGAGHIPVDGYLNVDARELDGIDIVADVRSLPFGPGEVSTLWCAHLLEHFPVEEVRRSLLPYWLSILKPGGRFVAVVPDSEAMLDGYGTGEISFDDLREVTFGSQEYDGDFHFNMYSKTSLTALLEEAGFVDVAITVSARRNGLCYEMQTEGRRPDATLAG